MWSTAREIAAGDVVIIYMVGLQLPHVATAVIDADGISAIRLHFFRRATSCNRC